MDSITSFYTYLELNIPEKSRCFNPNYSMINCNYSIIFISIMSNNKIILLSQTGFKSNNHIMHETISQSTTSDVTRLKLYYLHAISSTNHLKYSSQSQLIENFIVYAIR